MKDTNIQSKNRQTKTMVNLGEAYGTDEAPAKISSGT